MKTNLIKNYLKISAFFLLVLLLFKNCETDNQDLEIETQTLSNRTFNTVPFSQAKEVFNTKQENQYDDSFFARFTNPLELTPHWETLVNEDLFQIEEAQLVSAEVDVNRSGNYNSKLIFLNVNGQVKNAIYTIYEERTDTNGTVLDARIYLNEIDGTFIDGYKIQDEKFVKRFIVNSNGNVSQGSMLAFLQVDTEDDCWNTDNLPEDGQLDEVDLGTLPGSSGGYNPSYGGIYSTIRDWNNARTYGDGDNGSNGASSGSDGYSGVAGTIYGNNVDTEDEPENDVLNFSINLSSTIKIEPEDELQCFDTNLSAKLIVYVQQPRENTEDIVGPNEVGHAFVGIEQNGIVRQLGFYPDSNASQGLVAVGVEYDSELRDNYNYLYHVSISRTISNVQLLNIINYIENFPSVYDVNEYACTDFAIEVGNLGGLELPSTTVSYLTFTGRSPGVLGQEIRAMQSSPNTPDDITITTISTNSPSKQGSCN